MGGEACATVDSVVDVRRRHLMEQRKPGQGRSDPRGVDRIGQLIDVVGGELRDKGPGRRPRGIVVATLVEGDSADDAKE